MAILSSIRNKSWLLIVFVGLAMFLFVASPDDILGFFNSKKLNSVGNINGEEITREEFTERVKQYATGNNNISDTQASRQVWENIVAEKIFDEQLEKAGIVVGEKEIWKSIISDPSINSSPTFLNEAGLFDEESLKTYIAEIKDDKTEDGRKKWAAWLNYEIQVKQNLERNAYINAVTSGLGISLAEAKYDYTNVNTKLTGKYVFLPYSSIPDSTINITDKEIEKYINEHKNQFKTGASRGIQYVIFNINPADEDKMAVKSQLEKLKNDFVEYNASTKTNDTIKGFANNPDIEAFVEEYSDLPADNTFIFKGSIPQKIDSLFSVPQGKVVGPYEDGGYYKISKVVEQKSVPVVKASHILISYKELGNPSAKYSKEEANTVINEILTRLNSGSSFAVEAQKYSEDPGSAIKGGDLDWFKQGEMVPQFNDWVFSHAVGDVGIVETQFGFHIIKKTDAKSDTGIRLASVVKTIEPSEKTVNKIFEAAESFNAKVSKDKNNFDKIAKEEKYDVKKMGKLTNLDDIISGLPGQNSQIVSWAFQNSSKTDDINRFDLDKAYVVVQLTDKQDEGITSVKNASDKVKPILMKIKKSELLTKKIEKGTLDEIASKNNSTVMDVIDASLQEPNNLASDKSPMGAMLSMKEGTVARGVIGRNGVYVVQLDKRLSPLKLESYEPIRLQELNNVRKDANTIYAALREVTDIGELNLQY